jgi:hypothetical protein
VFEAALHLAVELGRRQLGNQFGVGIDEQQKLHGSSEPAIVDPATPGSSCLRAQARIGPPRFATKGPEPEGEIEMRVMVLVKATRDSEAGVMPSEELLAAMGRYNEELVKAGVMLAGEGLHPSSRGARVRFSGTRREVIDGPFAETKELVAGFWLWQVRSMDEAIEWVRRCPNPHPGDSEIEIRPVFEAEDFGAAFTPELREQEERLRNQLAAKQ